jgi:hypothetical protein
MNKTSASRMVPYSSDEGMVLRFAVTGGPLGGAHAGSTSVGAGCTGSV